MDYINILKVKELWVLLRYQFGSERLKGRPKEAELVEAITVFCGDCEGLMQRVGGVVVVVVTNDMVLRTRFLV